MTSDRPTDPPGDQPPAPPAKPPRAPKPSGYWWALGLFALGVAASVAANVAHSYVPPDHLDGAARATWAPDKGAIVWAAVIPLALIGSVEVLTRTRWPEHWGWKAAKFAGLGLVAGVAAVISYKHLHGLLGVYGEDKLAAAIGPLAVDGLMLVASTAMLVHARERRAAQPAAPAPPQVSQVVRPSLAGDPWAVTAAPFVLPTLAAGEPQRDVVHARVNGSDGATAETPAPVPPRVRRLADQMIADFDKGDPLPESIEKARERYEVSSKGDAGDALRIARTERPNPPQQTRKGRRRARS